MSTNTDTRPSLAELRARAKRANQIVLYSREVEALLDIAEAARVVVAEGVEVGDDCIESKGADMSKLDEALAKVRP